MSVFHQSEAKRKLLTAARQAQTVLPAKNPPVFWMTDPSRTPNIVHVCENLPKGWGVIFRHFGQTDRHEHAAQIASVCKRRRLSLLIANDPMLAKHVGADGVHWPHAARTQAKYWRKAFPLMTVSAHSATDVRCLRNDLYDAAMLSCVFPSNSPTAGKPLGALSFRMITKSAPLPCYGLGGINQTNAQSVASTAGLAMVSAIDTIFGI